MKIIKNSANYLIAPTLSLLVVAIFFGLWNFDLDLPIFGYSQDSLFYLFVAKNIIQTGWFFQNDLLGYPHLDGSFYLHDFPIHADFFSFIVIKFLAIFSQNPFFLVNIFFLFTFALISFTAFVALRAFGIGAFSAILIAIIYAFLPYHFSRSVWHLFLSNYAVVPLIIMVALWICEGKILLFEWNKKEQISFAPNRLFLISFLVAIFLATNGIYYAFYGCIIFIFAWFLHSLKKGSFLNREFFTCVALCATVVLVLFLLYLPALIFWLENGLNSQVGNRDPGSSEFYSLRVVDLLMPIANHYLDYCKNLRIIFDSAFFIEGERKGLALGILSSAAFIFLLLWVLVKNQIGEKSLFQKTLRKFSLTKNDENLISNLSSLNLLSLLFATAGGLVILIVISFPLIRSHARFCIFIAFLALFLVAIIFDKISQKGWLGKIVIVVITILALLDQVGNLNKFSSDVEKRVQKFNSDRDFVTQVENNLAPNSQIFILPVFGFPESNGDEYQALMIYLHAQKLHLSYPAIRGRAANLWQEKIVEMDFKNFISELKKAGFTAVIIDRAHFAISKKSDWKKLRKLERNLKSLKTESLFSRDLNWVFFKI